jgi:hypothetical protein
MKSATPRSKYVRCKLCGHVLSGWLPIPAEPNGALLLGHLSQQHPGEVNAYLDRMHTSEDIPLMVMEAFEAVGGTRMNPSKPPMPEHVPPIDWPNLTDEALEELRTLVEAERQRRWLARRPRAPVDELHDAGRAPQPIHAEVFDTYHCRAHGTRYLSRWELRQAERDETGVYVCTLCGEVADPTPLF